METRSEFPDLKIGVTLADFQAEGTMPVFSERLIMCDIGFAIALAQSFKRFGGKESVQLYFVSVCEVHVQQKPWK